MSHLFLSGEVSLRACSGALACCTGMAHCRAQRTLRGNTFKSDTIENEECLMVIAFLKDFNLETLSIAERFEIVVDFVISLCDSGISEQGHIVARSMGLWPCKMPYGRLCDGNHTGLYSSVAERQSCKLKVLGSIPSGGFLLIS